MAVRAIGYVYSVRTNWEGNLLINSKVAIEDGSADEVPDFTAAINATIVSLTANLHAHIKDFAENVMGQTFEVLDTVRVFGLSEI